MATALHSQSAPIRAAAFATPPAKSKAGRSAKSRKHTDDDVVAKHAILENMEMEIAHKVAAFHRHLNTSLQAYMLHEETELARIPPELRKMTISDLEATWGGGWAGTLGRLTEARRAEAEERDAEAERKLREEANGQRKRGRVVSDSSPQRNSKNARKENTNTPLKSRMGIPSSASKRKLIKKVVPFISATPGKKGPSTLPQDFSFNPILGNTPLRKMNPSDMLYTVNGSPIANPLSKAQGGPSGSTARTALRTAVREESEGGSDNDDAGDKDESDESEEEVEEGDSGEDLVDPEAYARQLEAQAKRAAGVTATSKSGPTRGPTATTKRKPSLVWRQSLDGQALPQHQHLHQPSPPDTNRVTVRLDNGDELDFDPFDLDRDMLLEQFDKLGVDQDVRVGVERIVRDKVVEAELKRRKW